MTQNDYQLSKSRPLLLTRWWLKCKPPKTEKDSNGYYNPWHLYCPLWAKPLDFIYKLVFDCKIKPIEVKADGSFHECKLEG